LQKFIKNKLCKVSRPRARDLDPLTFETETRPETFETETSKNGSRDRDQVSRLHHWSLDLITLLYLNDIKPSNGNFFWEWQWQWRIRFSKCCAAILVVWACT